jgi:hypothetical protein
LNKQWVVSSNCFLFLQESIKQYSIDHTNTYRTININLVYYHPLRWYISHIKPSDLKITEEHKVFVILSSLVPRTLNLNLVLPAPRLLKEIQSHMKSSFPPAIGFTKSEKAAANKKESSDYNEFQMLYRLG